MIFLVYLKGRLLQGMWDSVSSVLKVKRTKLDSLHQLSEREIESVLVEKGRDKYIEIRDSSKIRNFKNALKNAKIRKIKYAYTPDRVKIKIRESGNEISYDALVLPTENKDAFLELIPEYPKYLICLPNLKRWLDENKCDC